MVAPGSLDLILCRNVIIYFDLPTIRGLMDRFLAALRPGGLLFLGYSESLFKVYDRFEMIEVDGAFVYRRPLVEPQARRAMTLQPLTLTPAARGLADDARAPLPSRSLGCRSRRLPFRAPGRAGHLKPAAIIREPAGRSGRGWPSTPSWPRTDPRQTSTRRGPRA